MLSAATTQNYNYDCTTICTVRITNCYYSFVTLCSLCCQYVVSENKAETNKIKDNAW